MPFPVRSASLATAFAASLIGSASADGIAYTYDAMGRLQTVAITIAGTTRTVTYTYDDAGNILTIVVS